MAQSRKENQWCRQESYLILVVLSKKTIKTLKLLKQKVKHPVLIV